MKKIHNNLESFVFDSTMLEGFRLDLEYVHKKSPQTIKNYLHVVYQAQKYFEQKNEGRWSLETFPTFIRHHSARISPKTQALWVSAMRSFFVWAQSKGIIHDKRWRLSLQAPKTGKKLTRVFSEDELPSFTRYMSSLEAPHRLLFSLLYGLGLRISEASELSWEDVDIESKVITILGKGSRIRRLPFCPGMEELFELVGPSPEGRIFPEGQYVLRSWVAKWGKESGLEEISGKLHPHKLRHAIATHLLRRGAKLPEIQKLLGHQQLSTTERYTQLSIEDLTRAYDGAMPEKLK